MALQDQVSLTAWYFNRILNSEVEHILLNRTGPVFQNIDQQKDGTILFQHKEHSNSASSDSNCEELYDQHMKSDDQFYLYDSKYENLDVFSAHSTVHSEFSEFITHVSDSLIYSDLPNNELTSFYSFKTDPHGNEKLLFILLIPENNNTGRKFTIGLETTPNIIVSAIEKVWSEERLVPPDLTKSEGIEEFLYITINTPSGAELFSTYPADVETILFKNVVNNNLNPFSGDIYLQAGIAGQTLIGSTKKQQVSFLLGLFGLASILSLVVFYFVKKESDLALIRSDFISSASHDLRTPITQIRMFSETLLHRRTRSLSEKDTALRIIDQESKRLSGVVSNILDFSKIDKNVFRKPDQSAISVNRLLEEIIEDYELIAGEQGIKISKDLENIHTSIDKHLVRQIITNLIDNAVKYSEDGKQIHIYLKDKNDTFLMMIEDEGPGIRKSIKSKIWDPYWRDKIHAESTKTGVGLGLAIVQHNISLLQGTVEVENRKEGGARFTVRIPKIKKGIQYGH